MSKLYSLVLMVFLITGCSCSESNLSKQALIFRVQEAEPDASIVIPTDMDSGVHCSDYPAGCLGAHVVNIRDLNMIFVEFQDSAHARKAAEKIGQYSLKNWVLDDVAGEPKLEDFVEQDLQAQRSKNAGPRKIYKLGH